MVGMQRMQFVQQGLPSVKQSPAMDPALKMTTQPRQEPTMKVYFTAAQIPAPLYRQIVLVISAAILKIAPMMKDGIRAQTFV